MKTFIALIIGVRVVLSVMADDTNSMQSKYDTKYSYYIVNASPVTNMAVIACDVIENSRKYRNQKMTVYYVKDTQQALVAGVTNNIYFENGKIYRLRLSDRSFWVDVSRQLEYKVLNEDAVKQAIKFSLESASITNNKYKRFVDLAPYLTEEGQIESGNGLILKSAKLNTEKGKLVAQFESYTGKKGFVAFDENENPVSIWVEK